jgi:hypothetical protein
MRRSGALRRAVAIAAAGCLVLSIPMVAVARAPSARGGGAEGATGGPGIDPLPIILSSFKVERFCFGPCPLASPAGSLVAYLVTASNILAGTPWKAYTGKVKFTSTDPNATLPAQYTFTGAGGDDGTHLFTVTYRTAGMQTLTVTSVTTATMDGTSAKTRITAADPDHTTFVVQPGGAAVGSPLATQPVVEIRDQYENTAASTANVTLSIVPPAGSAGAALTCASGSTVAAVAGTATFAGCSVDKAGVGYRMVATSPGTLAGTSAAFTIDAGPGPSPTPTPTPTPTPGPVGTLLLTAYSPYLNNNAIDWGQYIDLTTTAPAGTAFQIQVTTDHANWTTLSDANATPLTFTIGSSGAYTYRYTPIRNYWYRSVAGSTMTDGALRVTVRQTATVRPIHTGTMAVSRGTTVTFSVQVRPARPELQKANVVFQLYRRSGGSWVLSRTATVVIDGAGMALYPFTFAVGTWYVRAQAQPTPVNANSFWTPNQFYKAS